MIKIIGNAHCLRPRAPKAPGRRAEILRVWPTSNHIEPYFRAVNRFIAFQLNLVDKSKTATAVARRLTRNGTRIYAEGKPPQPSQKSRGTLDFLA